MNKKEIILNTQKHLSAFNKIIKDQKYEYRGIFNSEALLLITLAKELDVSVFIESGRARAYSTKIFADFFSNDEGIRIVSIDFEKHTADAQYGEQVMQNYENVELVYGDARAILPTYIKTNESCMVFIDGPKGDEALLLAAEVLKQKNVKAVAIHDLHKNTFHRNICEIIFPNAFFSDDTEYVEAFRQIDNVCWEELVDKDEAPYERKGKKIESYASTLAIIFNNDDAINDTVLENYKKYYNHLKRINTKRWIRNILKKWPVVEQTALRMYQKIK